MKKYRCFYNGLAFENSYFCEAENDAQASLKFESYLIEKGYKRPRLQLPWFQFEDEEDNPDILKYFKNVA